MEHNIWSTVYYTNDNLMNKLWLNITCTVDIQIVVLGLCNGSIIIIIHVILMCLSPSIQICRRVHSIATPCWLLWMYIMQEVLLFMHLNYDCWMRLVLCQIINVILHVHTLLKGSIYGCSLDVGMSLIYYTWIFMSYIFGFNEILRMI